MTSTSHLYFGQALVDIHENINQCTTTTNQNGTVVDLLASKVQFHSRYTSLDVCGVDKNDYGRQCQMHGCCGNFVKIGDVLFLKKVNRCLMTS